MAEEIALAAISQLAIGQLAVGRRSTWSGCWEDGVVWEKGWRRRRMGE